MMTNKNIIDELIVAYLSKEIDEEGLKELQEWLSASEANRLHFARMQELWFSSQVLQKGTPHFDKERAYTRFILRREADNELKAVNPVVRKTVRLRWWYSAAAVALVLLVAGGLYWSNYFRFNAAELADVKVVTPSGSISQVYLPDGTSVWLKPGSFLSYSRDFGRTERKIKLLGEAFVEVAPKANIPFSVESGTLWIRDIGTKFSVKNYTEDTLARIVLIEGKVLCNDLSDKRESIEVSAKEQLVYNKTTRSMAINPIEPGSANDWHGGVLNFDEASLGSIVNELMRCYNIRIRLTDSRLKSLRFYGNFRYPEQSITDVLGTLSATGKFRFRMGANGIELYVR